MTDTLELVHNVSYKFFIFLYVCDFNILIVWPSLHVCCCVSSMVHYFIVKHFTCKSLLKDVCENQVKMENEN